MQLFLSYIHKGLLDVHLILPWEEDHESRLFKNAVDLHHFSCQELDLTKNKEAQIPSNGKHAKLLPQTFPPRLPTNSPNTQEDINFITSIF